VESTREFFRVKSVDEVLDAVSEVQPVGGERVSIEVAAGRVTAAGIVSSDDVPHFDRATMDGYAVRASDVAGSTESYGVRLRVVGSVQMGVQPGCVVGAGETAEIGTGAMLPQGADAVVMVEHTEREPESDAVRIHRAVLAGENVMARSADWSRGEEIVRAGTPLRAAHVAALAACGIVSVDVRRRPSVAVISTGDELVPCTESVPPGRVRDSNSVALAAALQRDGTTVNCVGIVPDDESLIRAAVRKAVADSDMVLISAGSSVGRRDFTLDAIRAAGRCKVIAHGLDIRPGKPTIIALVDDKPVLGLPGHPVSSLVCYEVVVRRVLWRLLAVSEEEQITLRSQVRARLAGNVASLVGRTNFVRVRIEQQDEEIWAYPLPSVSGAISTLSRAHGWIVIEAGHEGLARGTMVTVTVAS